MWALKEFAAGVADLGRGARMWATSPRLMLLGAIPALVVALASLAALVLLVVALPGIAAGLTPFADGWDEPLRGALRALVGAVVLAAASVLLVLGYAAITVAVGSPWYERISSAVEVRLGDPPTERVERWTATVRRGIADGLRLFAGGAVLAVVLLLLGLVPVVGWALALATGLLFGGRLLAVELTAFAFDARGIHPSERRRRLAARRARSQGFGAAAYLLLLLPPVAVVAMPAAVAGATVLARAVLAPADPDAPQ